MEIEKYVSGPVTVIALEGDLNSSTAPQVQQDLERLMPGEGSVLLDLSRTAYMSSAGLRVLLLIYRQTRCTGVRLALAGVPGEVHTVMIATGFAEFFTVTDTVESGLEELAA